MDCPYRYHVLPCSGPHCTPEKGEAFKRALKDLLPDRKALGVRVSTTSCQGMCERGPNVTVYPEGIAYHRVTLEDLPRIVDEHLRHGCPVREIADRTLDEQLPELD
jgi:(2Fe-2S) ferredoxin